MQEIVPVLQRDEAGLQGPQQDDPAAEDQRRPQHHVNPDRRGEFELNQGGEPDDDQPEEEDHEHLRAVTRILGGEIEPAARAGRAHGQETGEEAPSPQRGQRQPSAARVTGTGGKCRNSPVIRSSTTLQARLACFETRPAGAPQHEVSL